MVRNTRSVMAMCRNCGHEAPHWTTDDTKISQQLAISTRANIEKFALIDVMLDRLLPTNQCCPSCRLTLFWEVSERKVRSTR